MTRSDGKVLLLVWGRPERCQLAGMLEAVGSLMPPPAAGSPQRGKFGLHEPGVLEGWATEAGLDPEATGDLMTPFEFADAETALRQLLAPGSVVLAARAAGQAAVSRAILDSLEPFKTPTGAYRLENEWHYLVASA